MTAVKRKPGPKARAKARKLTAEATVALAEAARIKAGQPAPVVVQPPPAPPPLSLISLGAPPLDSLGAQHWAHRATVLAMHDTMTDPTITPRERRKEMRALATAAAKLMPDSRRWEAEQMIREDRAELERKERGKHGAQLEPVPDDAPSS